MDAKGVVTLFSYDELGRCVDIANSDGRVVARTFDDRYNLVREHGAGRGETRKEFDAVGRVVGCVGPAGSVRYSYDQFGHLSEVIAQPGQRLFCTYDPYGCLLKVKMGGRTTEFEWDDMDRMVKQVVDGQVVLESKFNPVGRLIWQRDANGWIQESLFQGPLAFEFRPWRPPDQPVRAFQRFLRDREGRILRVEDEHGVVVRLTFDTSGKVAAEEFAGGLVRQRAYEEGHRLAAIVGSGGTRSTFAYDGGGRVAEIRFSDQFVQTRDYDEGGRLVRALHGAPGNEVEAEFEADGSGGEITRAAQNGWGLSARFDDAGRRLGLEIDGFPHELLYEYAPNGRISAWSYGPWKETYDYTPLGSVARRCATNGVVEQFDYDADGRQVRRVLTTPLNQEMYVATAAYDLAGRIEAAEDSLRGRRRFAFDQSSRLIAVNVEPIAGAGQPASSEAETYVYEGRGRLAVANGRAVERHQLDDAGRVKSLVRGDGRLWLRYRPEWPSRRRAQA